MTYLVLSLNDEETFDNVVSPDADLDHLHHTPSCVQKSSQSEQPFGSYA